MTRPFDQGSAEGAAHPELVTIGTPQLRQATARVSDFKAVQALCEKLIEMLSTINGAGLAANQIGVWERVMCFQVRKTELHPDRPETPLYVMINPDILEKSDETVDAWEGCFSVPGYMGLVPRALKVKCRYNSRDGVEHIEEFEGWAARVIQHECDHLDGKVYLDRMKSMLDFSTSGNYKQFQLLQTPPLKDDGSDAGKISTIPDVTNGSFEDTDTIPDVTNGGFEDKDIIPDVTNEPDEDKVNTVRSVTYEIDEDNVNSVRSVTNETGSDEENA